MKKIIFITGTRADYGKLKSILLAVQKKKNFKAFVFVTGMHNLKAFGNTFNELITDKVKNIYRFRNIKNDKDTMDIILSNTIQGFSKFLKKTKPDLVVTHGDRVETLACAISASLNNVRLAHMEGGEITGTIDEIIRHSITKLAHIHLVTNVTAKKRLIQMGEDVKSIFIIGSPDLDIMLSKKLPSLKDVKKRYKIKFENYAIAILHPVTTELDSLSKNVDIFLKVLTSSNLNYVLIYPNNDNGHKLILKKFKNVYNKKNIKILRSIRFERYLTLLKNSNFIIGNSSSGIVEAPFYGIPTINLGTRQNKRAKINSIINLEFNFKSIINEINNLSYKRFKKNIYFGKGDSHKIFMNLLKTNYFWKISNQKTFNDLKF